MQGDAEARVPAPPPHDLWQLPKIAKLKIERVRYAKPRRHAIGGRVVEFREGVEILVDTAGEIPIRALSPALYIGTAEVAENERIAESRYRFFVLDEERLRDGSPISLGWAGIAGRRTRTKFRYRSPRRNTEG